MNKSEGRIYRHGKSTIVEIAGFSHLVNLSGVVCVNPQALEAERVYRKEFIRKKIYLPRDYDRAVAENLSGSDVLIIGFNGYSSLTPEKCQDWGVKPGAYEAACYSVFMSTIKHLQAKFNGIDIRIVHGASDIGVDKIAIKVSTDLNRPQLGHSCPKFMFYVPDDNMPIYVAATQAEYAHSFIHSLHVLIAANGRAQAFEHDIDAAFKLRKHIIPINILKSISTTGGPPAFNASGEIEDAVAAMEHLVHMVSTKLGMSQGDMFEELRNHINKTVTVIARQILSVERAFEIS